MSVLREARKAVFGETWALPILVAVLLAAAAGIKLCAPDLWRSLGGPFLLGGAAVVLVALVERARSG